jgi:hypothetical protein
MDLAIADQVKLSFQVQNRTAAVWGATFGAMVPLAAFAFSHFCPEAEPLWRTVARWAFVAFCLSFSAPKVYRWGCSVFASGYMPRGEAGAFALLLEGAMVLADHSVAVHAVASYAFLAVLVAINALYCACSAALNQRATRAAVREASNPDTLSLAPTAPTLAVVPKQRAPRRTARPLRKAVSRG